MLRSALPICMLLSCVILLASCSGENEDNSKNKIAKPHIITIDAADEVAMKLESQKFANGRFCQPNQDCWPTELQWQELNHQVQGRLLKLPPYMAACKYKPDSQACATMLKRSQNPFFLQSQAQDTQISGWLNAWESTASPYAVAAKSNNDIVAAVNFARKHNLRVVIKGAGHDYLGRNNAANSLLIWTHEMRGATMQPSFIPQGCPADTDSVQGVTVLAGTRWLEAYDKVTTQNGRYVQGGNCTSVGAAGGFIMGGGFGSYSRTYGMGSDGLLEVELVTADGKVIVANQCQNQDLFWALHGGGGGTFGIVTKMTLKTHELPTVLGMLNGKVHANSDQAYKKLIEEFLNFYRENLNTPYWGKIISLDKSNDIGLALLFQNLYKEQAEAVWAPFVEWVKARPKDYTINIDFAVLPKARDNWDPAYYELNYPKQIHVDKETGTPEKQFWWANHQIQVGLYLYSYASRWIPEKLLEPDNINKLADALFFASRSIKLELHPNKGLAGTAPQAQMGKGNSAINPSVYDAAMLVILGAGQPETYPGVKGHDVDRKDGKRQAKDLQTALTILRMLTPGSGSYSNEADYFEPNWQESFWGSNYPRLLAVKKKYDPDNFFTCHHCVGSEEN